MENSDRRTFKFDLNALYGLMIISLPLSIKLFFPPVKTEILYPAEIFIGLLAILFFFDAIFKPGKKMLPEKKFLLHPLTILVFLYLIANVASTFTSTMFLVSFKTEVVKISYIIVFYFLAHFFIRTSIDSFSSMIKLYGISISLVIIFSLLGHSRFGFSKGSSGFISYPFYTDHTIYAAALAFIIPAFVSFFFFSSTFQIGFFRRIAFLIMAMLIMIALFYSFSRGAWISLIASICLFTLFLLGVRIYHLVFLAFTVIFLLFNNWDMILKSLKQNKVNSNEINAGLYEQLFSLTNITTDLSNAERINRWSSAARMFIDKPIFGFGPGTYQFQYFTYQKKEEMTPISLKQPIQPGATTYTWSPPTGIIIPDGASVLQGHGGSSHSEYFLALSETGIFSFIAFAGLLLVSLRSGLRIFTSNHHKKIKVIAMFSVLGLVTYFVHGLFNNFLDDCKLAFLFWSSLCAIATIDSDSYVKD